MRFLTAILLLAAALPNLARAGEDYSGGVTVRFLDLDHTKNQGLVQEYDGKQYDGAEADLKFNTAGKEGYLDLQVNSIGSADEDGYFDLNLGSFISVKRKFSILTHRTAFLKTGLLSNGVYENTTAAPLTYLNKADTTAFGFKRTESETKLAFACQQNLDNKLTVGLWQENEIGNTISRISSSRLTYANVDRQTKDFFVGLNAGVKEGAVSLDYTQRLFEDFATPMVMTAAVYPVTPPIYNAMPGPDHKMDLYDLRYRTGVGAKVPVTLALSSRARRNESNNYKAYTNSVTLAAAFKPAKKVSVIAKVYGRTVGIYEDASKRSLKFVPYNAVAYNAAMTSVTDGPVPGIDRLNLAGDLKANYNYSDKLSFNAAYKYETNYRRHVEEHSWETAYAYIDSYGVYYDTGTADNVAAKQDTRHTISAGAAASLPFDAELQVGYSKALSNHAVFNGMPDEEDKLDASVSVPLPAKLTLVVTADYLAASNDKSDTKWNTHQNSYQTALEWAGTSKVSAGVDYAYSQRSDHSEQFHGYRLTKNIHIRGALSRYENNVIGLHAKVQLPKGFSLDGNGTYVISRGIMPDNLDLTGGTTRIIFAPVDVRIANGMVALKYAPAKYKDLTARLGYRRSQWIDKYVSANSGWANIVDLSASTRF